MTNYLNQINLQSVTEKQNNNLMKSISIIEIIKTIEKGKLGKSPGEDGYTYEFYKEHKQIISPLLLRVYNEVLNTGKWPQTWKNAIVTVMVKEGKDPTQCTSYRPISLLNVDQNIFTTIIADRLLTLLTWTKPVLSVMNQT